MTSKLRSDSHYRKSTRESRSPSYFVPNSINKRFAEDNISGASATPFRGDDFHAPPSYGMLEIRSIVLADGSLRTYYALPPDYENISRMPQRLCYRPEFTGPHTPPFPVNQSDDGSKNEEKQNMGGKRKFVGDGENNVDGFERQRQKHQLLQYRKKNEAREAVETQFPHIGEGLEGNASKRNHADVDQKALDRVFFHFLKLIYEAAVHKKKYLSDGSLGPLRCLACSRTSACFPDTHSLIMHAYNSEASDARSNHLAFHKSLCVLMGWNSAVPPDDLKVYQNFSIEEAENIRADLIMWPPTVLVYSVAADKGDKGRIEGIGNRRVDSLLKDFGFSGFKSTGMYSREGHSGIHIVKFSDKEGGLKEALRMSDYFKNEKKKHGCKDWELYDGHLCTIADLHKLTFEFKKKLTIKSMKQFK